MEYVVSAFVADKKSLPKKAKEYLYKDKLDVSCFTKEDHKIFTKDLILDLNEQFTKNTDLDPSTITSYAACKNNNVIDVISFNSLVEWDSIWMAEAVNLSKYSKCQARKVAAVIVDNDIRSIVASGINGSLPGKENCNSRFIKIKNIWHEMNNKTGQYEPCYDQEAHHKWSEVHEIHAEVNAINNLAKTDGHQYTIYITHCPCTSCAKLIAKLGFKRVVFVNEYDKSEEVIDFLKESGILVDQL